MPSSKEQCVICYRKNNIMDQHKNKLNFAIRTLWRNWAVAFGCPALVTLASTEIPPIWLPLLCLILAFVLMQQYRRRIYANNGHTRCSRVGWLTAIAMIATAVVMTVINFVYSPKILPLIVAENPRLPFISAMIVYPLMCAVSIYGLRVGKRCHCCQKCQLNHGFYGDESSVKKLYLDESQYQLKMILGLSAVISLVDLAYFCVFYINVNLSLSDRFFFIIAPVSIYLISLLFMMRRYFTMYAAAHYLDRKSNGLAGSQYTLVRFLLFAGDSLLLRRMPDGMWDTPVQEIVPHTTSPGDKQIDRLISEALGPGKFDWKYIFTNDGYINGANVMHYAVFLPDDYAALPDTEACTISTIQRLLRQQALSPYIANELYRIHTVTMAWKTYDRDGRRLYPIKNYRPTFRFSDMRNWTVDYNDALWLRIASNNQDRPLWKIRRLVNHLLWHR